MTAAQVARRMKQREALVEREFRASSRGLAISAVKFAKEKLTQEVYAIPEAVTKGGKKKWRRTGHLRRSERYELQDAYTVLIKNGANYALPRHEAGKPGHRKIDPVRESHWRDELVTVFAPIVLDVQASTLEAILKAGQI